MDAPKRRFQIGEGLQRAKQKANILGPELEDDGVRLAYKINKLSIEEIKERIPKLIYQGILLSLDILYNDHLRGTDPKKRLKAAAEFVSRLGDANLLKNVAALAPVEDKKKPAKAEWGAAPEKK